MSLPFPAIAPEYDRLNDVLSWGMHRLWKRRLVRRLHAETPSPAPRILDVATGTGDLARLFRRRFELSDIVGIDPCQEMLSLARRRVPDVEWVRAESESLPLAPRSVGVLSCAFGVRNFRDRRAAFAEWKRVLAPGGVVGLIEIHPVGRGWLRVPVELYWRYVVPLWGQWLSKREAYEYLRDSGEAFLTAEAMRAEIVEAGLQPLYFASLFPCGMVSLSLFRNAKGAG